MNNPQISVIVPVYNAQKYLSQCVDSILTQSFSDFELLLVDDGSEDNSYSLCQQYAEKDFRVKVLHDENRGVSAARNAGMATAKGKYITFIDADDYVDKTFLQMLYEVSSLGFPVCGLTRVNGENEVISAPGKDKEIYPREKFPVLLVCNFLNSPVGKLFQKDIIDKENLQFNTAVDLGEDLLFVVQYVATQKQDFCLRTYAGYYYRQYNIDNRNFRFLDTYFETQKIVYDGVFSCAEKIGCEQEDIFLIYKNQMGSAVIALYQTFTQKGISACRHAMQKECVQYIVQNCVNNSISVPYLSYIRNKAAFSFGLRYTMGHIYGKWVSRRK